MTATGPRYRVQFRRKREKRTDYRQRLRLLRSNKPRLVVRISLNHVSAQVVNATASGDVTLASAHSKQLQRLGWKCGSSNLPAAYLVGLLCGLRAVRLGIRESTLDIGMHHPTRGGKVFAALKGAVDGGLQIPHDEAILPSEERIRGSSISDYAAVMKGEDEEEYRSRFSGCLSRGLEPEGIQAHFSSVKQEIMRQFGG